MEHLDSDGVGDNADACLLEYHGAPTGTVTANTNDANTNDSPTTRRSGRTATAITTPTCSLQIPRGPTKTTIRANRDAFPFDPTEWNDTDGEGVGDNSDRFPSDASEWNDTDDDEECPDFDGVGDEAEGVGCRPLPGRSKRRLRLRR